MLRDIKAKGIELLNQERIRKFEEKGNYNYLGILKTDIIEQEDVKEKHNIRLYHANEKTSRNQDLQQKYHQREKHLRIPPLKILGTILKMDKRGTHINGTVDEKIDDDAQGITSKRRLVSRKEGRRELTYSDMRG